MGELVTVQLQSSRMALGVRCCSVQGCARDSVMSWPVVRRDRAVQVYACSEHASQPLRYWEGELHAE